MVEKQKEYVSKMRKNTKAFIKSIDKNEIDTILLSGSVSRGDYCPGKKGGMIDLIVMKKDNSKITAEKLFGENQDPHIPYHCIKWNGEWFAIMFTDFINCERFNEHFEPRKFAIMESKILFDTNNRYKNELEIIKKFSKDDIKNKLKTTLRSLKYIMGKEPRWEIREAYPHMRNNLNISLELGISCIYYLNGKYTPADDRKLYYTYGLKKLPKNYEQLIVELFQQKMDSKKDYERRKKLFFEEFVGIM